MLSELLLLGLESWLVVLEPILFVLAALGVRSTLSLLGAREEVREFWELYVNSFRIYKIYVLDLDLVWRMQSILIVG